jgi:hypothetical protein
MFFTSTKLLFGSLIVFFSFSLTAQHEPAARLELLIHQHEEEYEAIPVKEHGVVLYRSLSSVKNHPIEIIHTDTSFNKKWSGLLPIEKGYALARHTLLGDNLFLAFYKPDFTNRFFQVFKLELQTGNYTVYTIRNSIPFVPTSFEVTPKGALLGGYFIRVPLVIFFNFSTFQSNILPGLFNEPGELTQIKVKADGAFDILISAKNFQKQKTLWLKSYSAEGNLVQNTILQPKESYHLLFGSIVQPDDSTRLIAGVYGSRNAEYSQGIFITQLSSDNEQYTRYYNFADLENFFHYLKAKRALKIKERIARKKIKGKKIRLQYRFIVHDLKPFKDQYVLLGEAFYPRYRTTDRTGIGFSAQYNTLIFDGYQYTHAAILGIDKAGKLLWDNSFEIKGVKTFTLEQFVKVDAQGDDITLLYLFDNKIRTKIIQNNTLIEGTSYSSTPPSGSATQINQLDYWYNNYFIAKGVQQSPSSNRFARGKKIFFLHKVYTSNNYFTSKK